MTNLNKSFFRSSADYRWCSWENNLLFTSSTLLWRTYNANNETLACGIQNNFVSTKSLGLKLLRLFALLFVQLCGSAPFVALIRRNAGDRVVHFVLVHFCSMAFTFRRNVELSSLFLNKKRVPILLKFVFYSCPTDIVHRDLKLENILLKKDPDEGDSGRINIKVRRELRLWKLLITLS